MLAGRLSEAEAELLSTAGPEAVRLALLAANARIAQLQPSAAPSPATPSGMVPPYQKPPVRRRNKKPGAKPGHPGRRRQAPPKVDARVEHRLSVCPGCGGELQRCKRQRTRIIEDIPQQITPIVTEHTLHRDYCPACKKHVEPAVPDALAGATLGHHIVTLSGWFHYGLGITISQIIQILGSHLSTLISAGGLVDAWRRTAAVLEPWYQQIAEQAKAAACLNCDETGWRVNGVTHWLWCFSDRLTCYFQIDRCRGSPALKKFFTAAFMGTLVHDFWAAYESVCCEDRQYCLVHLLRELEKVEQHIQSIGWQSFAKLLRRLIRDGIRLRKRSDFTPQRYRSRIHLIHLRLCKLADEACAGQYADADAKRLGERISRHRDHLFTFLDRIEVPFENNHAERQIRPAVVMRKNIQGNRSDQGAHTQAVLMSIFRTLKLRGHADPTKVIAQALRQHLQTGKLPPLPGVAVAEG
jgi:transposase